MTIHPPKENHVTNADVRRVLEQIDYLEEAWPQLVTLGIGASTTRRRLPAGRRRSDAALERVDREARIEAEERSQPGWVPAISHPSVPVDVTMLDLLAMLVSVAEDLAATVTQTAGVERPSHATSAVEDPRPYLRTARAWLTAAQEADDRTVPWATGELTPVVRAAATALGEIVDGQVLDALCPWCGGRTERHPMGGQRTLVVDAGPTAVTTQQPAPEPRPGDVGWPRIVCHGLNCTPPASACGAQVHGQPAWPEREWDWLAKQLDPADTPSTARMLA